jgi:Ca-activated chloride channel family protein
MLRHPWLLLAILLVPAIEWWRARAARRTTFPFGDGAALADLPRGWAVRARPWLPVLHGLGLALLVVAAARPQRGVENSRIRTEGVDIVLVMDVSTSMRAEDFSTPLRRMNRLDAAREVVGAFIRARPRDRIGLVAFSAMPYVAAPLTLDHDWLVARVEGLQTGMLEDGTAIGSAVASAVNRLRDSEAKSKVIVLLTDGMNNAGSIAPDTAAEAARALGLKLYAVGAGTRGVAPYPTGFRDAAGRTVYQPIAVEIDEALLGRMAAATGGRYFRATDLDSLKDVYAAIDRMETTEIEIDHFTQFDERFAPWAAAGLALLAAELALRLTRLGVLPS